MANMDSKTLKEASQDLGKKLDEETEALKSKIGSNLFQQGTKPKDLLGMNRTMVEGIYGQAYRLYNTGKYEDAIHIFKYLMMLDATEAKYLMGLAACYHMLKQFDAAIELYALAGTLDSNSPISYYHSTDCYMQMKDYVSAYIASTIALKRAKKSPEFATIAGRLEQTQETLKRLIKDMKEVKEKVKHE